MTFPDYAATETTALIQQLLARHAGDMAAQLRSVRDALDAASTLESPPTADDDIRGLISRLDSAFAAAANDVRQRARLEIDAVQADFDAARADLEHARTDLDSARLDLGLTRADLDAARAELDVERRLTASLSAQLADLEAVRGSLSTALAEREVEIDRLGAVSSDLEGRARAAEADLSGARARLADLESACASATAATQLAHQVKDALESELRRAHSRLQQADARSTELASQLESTAAESARLRDALEAAQAQDAQHAHARGAAERELADLRGSLDSALADLTLLGGRLDVDAAEKSRLLTELSAAQGAMQAAQSQHELLAAQLRGHVAKIQALERSHARQEETIAQLQARLETAPPPPAAVPAIPVIGTDAAADLQGVLSLLDASIRSVEKLGDAATIPDLLNSLAEQISAHFSRVALFTVKGNRLAGEHQRGFDHHTYVRKMVIPLTVDSMLTRVAVSGQQEWCTGADLADTSSGAPFRGAPAIAGALPITVRGETVAVVYADDASHGGTSQEPAVYAVRMQFARLLVRQAALSLLRLTEELRKVAELRDYATILIEGAEQMYAADVEGRRTPEDLRRRLQENLECARQIFRQRAALEGLATRELLDEQIAALVQSRTDDPFARELAGIVGIPYAAPPRSAEAS